MKPENAIDEDCEMKLLLENYYLKKQTKKKTLVYVYIVALIRELSRTMKNI